MVVEDRSTGGSSETSGVSTEEKPAGGESSELWSRYQARNKKFSGFLMGGQIFLGLLILAAVFIGLWIVVVR
jgi:hypothetical protein